MDRDSLIEARNTHYNVISSFEHLPHRSSHKLVELLFPTELKQILAVQLQQFIMSKRGSSLLILSKDRDLNLESLCLSIINKDPKISDSKQIPLLIVNPSLLFSNSMKSPEISLQLQLNLAVAIQPCIAILKDLDILCPHPSTIRYCSDPFYASTAKVFYPYTQLEFIPLLGHQYFS
jgi:hypothetical protein